MSRERAISTAARLADVILLAGSAASLLICSYFFYFYYWTGVRRFTTPSAPYLYYGAPACMALLLFAALKLRPLGKVNVALILCSAGVSIYSMEVLTTLWFRLPSVIESGDRSMRSKLAKEQGLAFDARNKAAVIEDLRSQGVDAVPAIFPQDLFKRQGDGPAQSLINIDGTQVLPLGGIANKPTIVCNEGGKFLNYASDEHGFNNPSNLWKTAPADVLAVGDSFTQGYCVSPDDNFVAQIRKRYPATLNVGIGGNGPLIELAALKEYGTIVKPKVVLWFYFEANDVMDLNNESHSPLLNRYLTSGFSQNLFDRQAEIDKALAGYIETVKSQGALSRTFQEISTQLKGLGARTAIEDIVKLSALRTRLGLVQGKEDPGPTEPEASSVDKRAQAMKGIMNVLHQVLSEGQKTVNEWGGALYFVYLPAWDRYASTGNGPNPDRNAVLQVVKDLGLPLIDIHEVFRARPDPLTLFPLRLGPHYNEEGHRLVAEEVVRRISIGQAISQSSSLSLLH